MRFVVSQHHYSRRLKSLDGVQNMKSICSEVSYGTPCWISASLCHWHPRKQISYPHDFNGSNNPVTSSDSGNEVFCKTNVFTGNSMTFATAWTVNSETTALVPFDATSQTGAPSMVYSRTNLDAGMAWRRVLKRRSIMFTASWWLHSCLEVSLWTHVASVHSTASYWSTTWSGNISVLLRPVTLPFFSKLIKRDISAGQCTIPCYW